MRTLGLRLILLGLPLFLNENACQRNGFPVSTVALRGLGEFRAPLIYLMLLIATKR